MKSSKVIGFLMVLFLALTVTVTVAGSAVATDIENVTTEVTALFIDLIPLIVILGVFGMIMGVIKFRK